MTTIKQILEWPVGYKGGGFNLVVKTPKKTITDAQRQMFHNVCLMDDTGEILADVKLIKSPIPAGWEGKAGHYSPLIKRQVIHIITCEIQLSESDKHTKIGTHGKKLLVHEYKITNPEFSDEEYKCSSDMWEWDENQKRIIKGKCRHGIVCAMIQSGQITKGEARINDTKVKACVNRWVDFIMSGE